MSRLFRRKFETAPAWRWRNSSWMLATVAGLLGVFSVQAAGAQTPALRQGVSVPAEYCKQSSLTGPVFLKLLNAIIKHGDLTDIAFLQETLGTKFSLKYDPAPDGTPDPNWLDYNGDHVLGNPIHVEVVINKGSRIQEQGGEVAFVRFLPEPVGIIKPSFFVDCLALTGADFVSLLGRSGFVFIWDDAPGAGSAGKTLNAPGKGDTRLRIIFNYDSNPQIMNYGHFPKLRDLTANDVQISEVK